MAGIGFELNKMLHNQSFSSEIKAYLYSAIISSGPWLISIICLAILGIFSGIGLGVIEHELFRSIIIYTYAFSLIFIGLIQLVSIRYIADLLYKKKTQNIFATFITCTILVLLFGMIFSSLCYAFFEITLLQKVLSVILFLVVCMIWLSMIFLSAIKDYNSIVYAFVAGSLLSIIAAIQLVNFIKTDGYLIGYLIGQSFIMFCLLARLLTEFPPSEFWDKGLISYFKKFKDLILIGFIYNLGIWVDKIVFWTAHDARVITPYFKVHDLYEGPIFFSYLTIVPTIALFVLKIETHFYQHYKQYYAKITGKKDMASILDEKRMMLIRLKESLREVLIIQGSITAICIIFAPDLAQMVKLSPIQVPLIRITLIGSLLNVLLYMIMIIMFYFDLRKCIMKVSMTFLVTNASLSFLTTKMGFQFYGYGYTYASLISLVFAFYLLHVSMQDLEYITFAKQPIH